MTRKDNSSASGGGGNREGKGGGRRPPQTREVMISRALSFLLRHGGRDEGIELDEGGWGNVADVVGLDFFFESAIGL